MKIWTLLLSLWLSASLSAAEIKPWQIKVSIISDQRGRLKEYPTKDDKPIYQKRYIEAKKNERYRIRVKNESPETIAVVIAVDGRNILNGQKSWLKPKEPKYVLKPKESFDYEGWRTGKDKVNRFYFTDATQSYAAAWGDHTAMGVIAIAAYQQKKKPQTWAQRNEGTGYGQSAWSPSQQVSFNPRSKPIFKKFFKYEWRQSLCQRGILECNRFWSDPADTAGGFAPPPPKKPQGYAPAAPKPKNNAQNASASQDYSQQKPSVSSPQSGQNDPQQPKTPPPVVGPRLPSHPRWPSMPAPTGQQDNRQSQPQPPVANPRLPSHPRWPNSPTAADQSSSDAAPTPSRPAPKGDQDEANSSQQNQPQPSIDWSIYD